jgi:hypothetical protein
VKESITNKNTLTVIFGFLFIGGVAAILGVLRAAKNTEHPLGYIEEEHHGDIFVNGAHA